MLRGSGATIRSPEGVGLNFAGLFFLKKKSFKMQIQCGEFQAVDIVGFR